MPFYVQCFPDPESVVEALTPILELETFSFDSALEEFARTGLPIADWVIQGRKGTLTIKFERHENYLFVKVEADGETFEKSHATFQRLYLKQGGTEELMAETLTWDEDPVMGELRGGEAHF